MTSHIDDKTLDAAIQSASRLLKALRAEYDALTGNQLDVLVTALECKHQALDEIRHVEERFAREGWLPIRGETGKDKAWQAFSDLMHRCHRQNDINGRIIHMRQHSTRTALNLLHGQGNTELTAYNAKGKALSSPSPSRITTV